MNFRLEPAMDASAVQPLWRLFAIALSAASKSKGKQS
jgi:hypothetical protein